MVEKPPTIANGTSGCTPLVGVLMLDTRFPRFAGDIGHPDSLPWPSLRRTVARASVARIVVDEPLPPTTLERFVRLAGELVDEGATLLTTSCGFLHACQSFFDETLTVPMVTSSLTLLPLVDECCGGRGPVGIMTFDARRLGARHLGRSLARGLVIEGMERSRHFHSVIANDAPVAERAAMERDAVEVATRLAAYRPAAVVLECTNLSPYREAIRTALGGVPVLDLRDAIEHRLGTLSSVPGRGALARS